MYMILLKIQSYIAKYNAYLKAKRELYSLTDRDLADIGISRCDIEYIAWDSKRYI